MARQSPCALCAEYCDGTCPLYGATPAKLHTPKGAARAMLVGRVLKGEGDRTCYFDKDGFFYDALGLFRIPLADFSCLWEEL
jgi:hypothetical protein